MKKNRLKIIDAIILIIILRLFSACHFHYDNKDYYYYSSESDGDKEIVLHKNDFLEYIKITVYDYYKNHVDYYINFYGNDLTTNCSDLSKCIKFELVFPDRSYTEKSFKYFEQLPEEQPTRIRYTGIISKDHVMDNEEIQLILKFTSSDGLEVVDTVPMYLHYKGYF